MITKALPDDTPFYVVMRSGHRERTGHALTGHLVSVNDGETWHMVRACCGETAQQLEL